ncbi:hypothetical protein AB0L00_15875 [Actinoallomurus sp. NPDC052308]|uniref:hypothetical protein n=1 Tax=Actinoallomurus sp. NPDC052308 TaxID=3155530 RepID=UPI0034222D4D
MSDVLLFTISLAATVLGLLGSWAAYRRRGAASGMRGAAWSMVPMGAYLTGLTKFLSDLVFSPVKWAGVALFGLGALLYVASGVMLRKGPAADGGSGRKNAPKKAPKSAPKGAASKGAASKGELQSRRPTAGPAVDPDLAEIEQILKNRGIS